MVEIRTDLVIFKYFKIKNIVARLRITDSIAIYSK